MNSTSMRQFLCRTAIALTLSACSVCCATGTGDELHPRVTAETVISHTSTEIRRGLVITPDSLDPCLLVRDIPGSVRRLAENDDFFFVEPDRVGGCLTRLIDSITGRYLTGGDTASLRAIRSICLMAEGKLGNYLMGKTLWRLCWKRPMEIMEFMYQNRRVRRDAFEAMMIGSISDHIRETELTEVSPGRLDRIFDTLAVPDRSRRNYLELLRGKIVNYYQ